MKQDVEKMNKILKRIAVIGGTAAVLLCIGTGVFVRNSRSQSQPTNSNASIEPEETMQIETQAALLPENAAGDRDFLNRKLPEYPDDERAVFKIIEVIPHEACSIFPYLVEWGTEEEYNKNVPIGYEGLFWCVSHPGEVQMFSNSDRKASESNPFTTKKGYAKRDYLSAYNGVLGDPNSGKWYRNTDTTTPWLTQDGYFEYVGTGNGLYYLPVSFVAENAAESGIHYEIQAIYRKGNQTPQGEMYVKSPAYYWAKDHAATEKPQYYGRNILSTTQYNYELSFTKSLTGAYRADTSKLKEKTVDLQGISEGNASIDTYDYFLVVNPSAGLQTVTAADWAPGYAYYKKGNYQVAEAVQSDSHGAFVRVDDNKSSDGYTNPAEGISNSGYFIAYSDVYAGMQRYDVTFQKTAAADTGNYVANSPNWADTSLKEKYSFEYIGGNKGRYDLPFIYNTEGTEVTYGLDILEVEHNQGRYALASTEVSAEGGPIYVNKDASGLPCDYSRVITNIDFLNEINWDRNDSTRTKGITLGGNSWIEWGGWVFHAVTDSSEMGVTKLSSIHKNLTGQNSNTDTYFTFGDRIYVNNQRRVYRFYTRNSYVNNEWFKLLCYSDNPRDTEKPYSELVDGIGYDMNQTAEWNLGQAATKELLSAFDNQFRIEIIQMTPEELTPDDVEDADLLYFSSREGIEGMSNSWNQISQHLVTQGLDALPSIEGNHKGGGVYKYTSDISNDTLFAIYKSCIYERTTALMLNRTIRTDYTYVPASDNLMKLYYFMDYFKEAREWAYFIEDYPEYRDTYSTIRQYDGGVRPYKGSGDAYYNIHQPEEDEEAYNDFTLAWDPIYFEVRDPITNQYLLSGDTSFTNDAKTSTGKVYDGETKYLFQEYIVLLFRRPDQMHNIWKILNNRTGVGDIVVEITNAEKLADTNRTRVIYANEFDPLSFDVKYKVFRLGGKGTPTPLTDVTVTFEDTSAEVGRTAPAAYDTEYTTNVRSGFAIGGSADPAVALDPMVTERKIKVVATDTGGKTGEATVTVIVREAFHLN